MVLLLDETRERNMIERNMMKEQVYLIEGRRFGGRISEGLLEETWFHGEISCDEAKARLAFAEVGSFLVRNVGNLYIISFVGKTTGIKHVKVPSQRSHSLLIENPGLKTEYQVIIHILSLDCKFFLHPLDRPKDVMLSDSKILKDEESDGKSAVWQCSYCEIVVNTRQGLNKHKVTHGLMFCERCKTLYITTCQAAHRRKCDPNFILKCRRCSKFRTKNRTLLDDHKKICQANLKCSFCEKRFRREKSLRAHESAIHKKGVLCPFCNKTFRNDGILYSHQVNIHEDIVKGRKRKYPCPKCDYKATHKKLLIKHLNIHNININVVNVPFQHQPN